MVFLPADIPHLPGFKSWSRFLGRINGVTGHSFVATVKISVKRDGLGDSPGQAIEAACAKVAALLNDTANREPRVATTGEPGLAS